MGALREVGPGGHFLGCAHTQENYSTAFWRTGVLDYKPYETWVDEGSRSTEELAAVKLDKMLADYQQPYLDPATDEALKAYMAQKKASMPDAFI